MSGEYSDALSSLETALREALKAYVDWHVESWKMTREQWLKECTNELPTGDYFDGYNAGVESVVGSLEMFLEDRHG